MPRLAPVVVVGVAGEHELADLVAVRGAGVDDADDGPVVDHGDAGRRARTARRGPRRSSSTPGARRPLLEQQLLGAAGGGDVEAPARVGGDDQPGRRAEGPHEHDPLDVAAREGGHDPVGVAATRRPVRASSSARCSPAFFQSMPRPLRKRPRSSRATCSSTVRPGTTASVIGSSGTAAAPPAWAIRAVRVRDWQPGDGHGARSRASGGRGRPRRAPSGRCRTRRRCRPARPARTSRSTPSRSGSCALLARG